MTTAAPRKTADERREEILEAAVAEFARGGLHGTSTDDIARRAGVSQPYLFRLYGTKKGLFLAAVRRCFAQTLTVFTEAAAKVERDDEVLEAMGKSYVAMLRDRDKLLLQMHAYAACSDEDVCAVVREGFAELWRTVARLSGRSSSSEEVRHFFATGMLLNVSASMDLLALDEVWAHDCIGELIRI